MLLQVKEAKRTIKSPQVEKYSPDHDEKFWCYCCMLEMQKHVTDCNISVLYGGLLEHMSTPEHRTNTHKFWWDNKADPKLRNKFIVTEEETERFKSEVSKALEHFEEKEDVFIKQVKEQHRLEVLQSLSEVCFPGNLQAYPYLSICLFDEKKIGNVICDFSNSIAN
uniref:Coiled-coil domain containing 84 n=1 Tax=Cyprinus carpio TaxID=7962 RepID=A0A8C1L4X0_CYPCA